MKRITRLANKNDVDGIYEIEAANFDFPWSKNAIENSIINDDLQDIVITAVSYTHLTLRRIERCRSRWSPYH